MPGDGMRDADTPSVVQRYRALFESGRAGYVFIGLADIGPARPGAARVYEVNAAAREMLGCGDPPPDTLATLWPASTPPLTEVVAALIAGDGWQAALAVDLPDGRCLQVSASPAHDGAWLTLYDISALREAEARAREAEARAREAESVLHQSQAVAGLGSYVWTVGSDTVRWSPQLHALLELDEASFEAFTARIHPDDRERVLAHGSGVLTGEVAAQSLEYRLALPSGRARWVRDAFDVERDATGAPRRMMGTSLDITALKEVEIALAEALAESEANAARLRAAFEQAAVGIALTDASGAMRRVNARLAELFDRTPMALVGRPLSALFGHRAAFVEAQLAELAEAPNGQGAALDLLTRRPDGGRVWVRMTVSRVATPGAREAGFLALIEDRTAQRTAERQAVELERQLVQAQKLEALGQLAGGVAHDFNNILQIIQLNIDLLHRHAPVVAERPRNAISAMVKRATLLVRQLLTFSRRDAHLPEPFDLASAVDTSVRMFRGWLDERIRITLTAPADPVPVHADRGMIEQVLLNLCVNARDAMPTGGPLDIDVRAVEYDAAWCADRPWAQPGRFARLTVRDAGVGMPDAVRERAWEPFFTTKAPGEGTGLGLSAVYGVIARHDGLLELWSKVGVGTRVAVHLPLDDAAAGTA